MIRWIISSSGMPSVLMKKMWYDTLPYDGKLLVCAKWTGVLWITMPGVFAASLRRDAGIYYGEHTTL